MVLFLLWVGIVCAEEEDGSIVIHDQSSSSDQAGAHSTVTVDEDTPSNAEIADMLQQVPGSHVRRFGGLGAFSSVSIRGASTKQTTIHLNSIPLNPEGISSVNLSELPLHAFSQIDVYRSQAPLFLQNASIGGAINLKSRSKKGFSLDTSMGALGTQRVRGFLGSDTTQGFVDFFHTVGGYGYFDDNQTVYNSQDDQFTTRNNNEKWQGSALFSHRTEDWNVIHNSVIRAEGIPGSIAMKTQDVQMDTMHHLSSIQWNKENERWGHKILGWNVVRREDLLDQEGELYGGTLWNRWLFHSMGIRSFHRINDRESWFPSVGFTGRYEYADPTDLLSGDHGDRYDRSVAQIQLGSDMFGFDDQLSIQGAMQGHMLWNGFSTDTQMTWASTGRFSLLFRPKHSALSFWGSLQSAFRPPDLTELFGNRGMMLGNDELVPETATTFDIGSIWSQKESIQLQGAYFFRRGYDDIILVQNAQRQSIPINFAQTQVQGVECSIRWSPVSWLQWGGAATWTHSMQQTTVASLSGKRLPNVPMWVINSNSVVHNDKARITHNMYYTDGTPTDAVNRYWSTQRLLHNITLQWSGLGWIPTISLELRNMLNTQTEKTLIDPLQPDLGFRDQAVADFIGYPIPGRFFMFSLSWNDVEAKKSED